MEQRIRRKKFETRKSVNIIINTCKALDVLGEGVEYNLTLESEDLKSYISSQYPTDGKYKHASQFVLRITQHVGPERYGPWYVCLVVEFTGWTFNPVDIMLIGLGPTKGTFETLCSYSYSVDTTEIVDRIVSNIKINLK